MYERKQLNFFLELNYISKAHNSYRLRGEFSACTSKRLIWQITCRIEFKPTWPTFPRSFQVLSTDTDRRKTSLPVPRTSHRTGFSIFTILFSLSFECFFMSARNNPRTKSIILCFYSLQTLLSLFVLVLNTDWLKRL